jgi:hypothetical protein
MAIPSWRIRLAVFSIAFSLVAAACGSSAATPTTAVDIGPGCDHWCGNATANVTFAGSSETISGGGCYDTGADGIDVRIGDWQGTTGIDDYLMLLGWLPGGATPGPATAPPGPVETDVPASPDVAGSVYGTPFILGPDAVVTFTSATSGTFSGTDVNGSGQVTGSFTCG